MENMVTYHNVKWLADRLDMTQSERCTYSMCKHCPMLDKQTEKCLFRLERRKQFGSDLFKIPTDRKFCDIILRTNLAEKIALI